MSHNLTLSFARALLERAAEPLDATARASAVSLFVDGLAVAALGAGETGPRILADMAHAARSAPAATLIGNREGASIGDAARVNGAAMHVLDYEPMWNPANHALSTTLPALLALAEAGDLGAETGGQPCLGERLLAALAIGIEAQGRLRQASGQFDPGQLVFHPPGSVGPIGSAVACALLLGLDAARLAHAMGIAASRAGAVLANVGSMTKSLHCGQAAASGLDSALLAQRGFTADADALAGPRGYGRAFFGTSLEQGDLDLSTGPLHIVSPGPAFKLYPSQYGTHFVITAALAARAALPPGRRIEGVRIHCPRMPYVDRPQPLTGLAGKFSFQYTCAVALLDGTVTVASFTDERRFRADVVDLLPRIRLVPDDREGRFDRLAIEVVVETGSGDVVGECSGPPGIWGRPASPELLRDKAHNCFSAAFGEERGGRILDSAERIGVFDRSAFRHLMGELAAEVRPAKDPGPA